MALKLQGVDDSLIMKIGCWTGLTFLTYISMPRLVLSTPAWRNGWLLASILLMSLVNWAGYPLSTASRRISVLPPPTPPVGPTFACGLGFPGCLQHPNIGEVTLDTADVGPTPHLSSRSSRLTPTHPHTLLWGSPGCRPVDEPKSTTSRNCAATVWGTAKEVGLPRLNP
jgi:hypothetical protein